MRAIVRRDGAKMRGQQVAHRIGEERQPDDGEEQPEGGMDDTVCRIDPQPG